MTQSVNTESVSHVVMILAAVVGIQQRIFSYGLLLVFISPDLNSLELYILECLLNSRMPPFKDPDAVWLALISTRLERECWRFPTGHYHHVLFHPAPCFMLSWAWSPSKLNKCTLWKLVWSSVRGTFSILQRKARNYRVHGTGGKKH